MKLSPKMTLEQFENGYWYATELQAFAARNGFVEGKRLRKDVVEQAIKGFLRSGAWPRVAPSAKSKGDVKDEARGLTLALAVVRYTNSPATKAFLEREAVRLAPGYRRKSGARYRLNRWREDQLKRGVRLSYGALVREYVRLSAVERFEKIPHVRYINFLAEFLRSEKGATRRDGIRAWHALKQLNVPKDYRSWVKATRG